MTMNNIEAVVFAAGQGSRMESEVPKVLHPINGTPMILLTLKKLQDLGIINIVVVVGYKAEEVKKIISEGVKLIHPEGGKLKFAYQEKQIGTANSLETALPYLEPETENILVLNGDDSAFYSLETLTQFIKSHIGGAISMITVSKPEASNVGRVIRGANGSFENILEINEYLESGLTSDEVNCGAYIFDKDWVEGNINKVPKSPKGEFYITELLNIAKNEGVSINLYKLKDQNEWHGINTKEDWEKANSLMSSRA